MASDGQFDPNAAADLSLGIFGLPFERHESRLVVIPAPFEATVSYGGGTARGPAAVIAASAQVDLLDRRFGEAWRHGVFAESADPAVERLGAEAAALAGPIIARGGASPDDRDAIEAVDARCAEVNALIEGRVAAALAEERIPCVLGGEHAVSLGPITACAATGEIGVLQIDAHMDLRAAFEGFRYSHASVMHNALREVEGVSRLVQVGIRDYCAEESTFAEQQGDRVVTLYDDDLFDRLARGAPLADVLSASIDELPARVYVTIDIDGLDPSLCPNTGTPVPGGLSFRELSLLLDLLVKSGRTIVGCDLVEVSPGPDVDEWDANVGARAMFRLCSAAILARG